MVASKQVKLFKNLISTNNDTNYSQINEKLENNEKSDPTTFKALIRETSVNKYIVELKKNVTTSSGYLDLVKIPDLYVIGAGHFLRKLRLGNKLCQKDIARVIGVARAYVSRWEKNNRSIRLDKLIRIAEVCGVSKDRIYLLIDQGKITLKSALPVKFEQIRDIIPHLSPNKSAVKWQITLINCSKETLSTIKATINVKLHKKTSSRIIYSKELHNYLTTFFQYDKVPKINPPLTSEVKRWYEKGVDLKRAIICPCLQTDGTVSQGNQNYMLKFVGHNKILHDYFVDAMYFEYNELPTSYFLYSDAVSCRITVYVQKIAKEIINEIMKLAGNTKTKPAVRQTVEDYLNEPQPHLNYLEDAYKTEQRIALRIWLSTEGCISLSRHDGLIYPELSIACSHPDLAIQLQQIGRRLNIPFSKSRSKRKWSGIASLANATTRGCIEFLKHGGFIKGVRISSKSPYHVGINKDVLTLGILEFKKREKINKKLRSLSLKRVHDEINKIIKNREFRSKSYYIKYFS
jgi:transcriptional regulator with XRE-family HTH domain